MPMPILSLEKVPILNDADADSPQKCWFFPIPINRHTLYINAVNTFLYSVCWSIALLSYLRLVCNYIYH